MKGIIVIKIVGGILLVIALAAGIGMIGTTVTSSSTTTNISGGYSINGDVAPTSAVTYSSEEERGYRGGGITLIVISALILVIWIGMEIYAKKKNLVPIEIDA